ncbi:MFS transporter [Patulibacter minatonensis]|uniref:MFS transporter n=1 Tax=Patulibacter minatonensis TaxID=298163 RepID=UPI00047C77CD
MTPRAWAVLLVLSGAIFLEGLDVSMMGVALPSIREDLDLSTATLQWVVSAYVLGYGGFVLLGGRAADLLGRRRMFLLWLSIFLVFSGLGGLAQDGPTLIAARFVTGVAAGFMTPAGLSIITTSFAAGDARNRALIVYGAAGAAGFSMGMVAGGLLTSIGWRWVFFAPVVMAAGILVVALRILPETARPARVRQRVDVGGAVTVTAAMLLLVFGVVRAPDVDAVLTVATLLASGVLLAAFVAIERRAPAPLLRLGILRTGALVRSNVGAVLFMGAFVGFQFIVVLYLQELRGWTPLETGLALLVCGIDVVLAPTLTPRLVRRFGNLAVLVAGMVVAAVAYASFIGIGADRTYLAMLPTFVLIGIAFALTYGPLAIAATEHAPDDEQGLASALLNMAIQFGAALGVAAVTMVDVAATGGPGSHAGLLDGYRAALVVPVVAVALGAAIAGYGLLRGRRAPIAAGA